MGIDRRSVLRGAAAAGVGAWVAPMIASRPAAAAACSPTCSFPDFTVAGSGAGATTVGIFVTTSCTGQGGTVNRTIVLNFSQPTGNCPCAVPATRPSLAIAAPAPSWTGNPNVVGAIGGGANAPTVTINYSSNGTDAFVQNAPILLQLTCARAGGSITKTATLNIAFTASGGNCAGLSVVVDSIIIAGYSC